VGLTKDGAKVLLIDMDGQGNSSAYLNSYDPESKELGIADIFYKTPVSNRLKEIDEVMVATSYDNLWIVPSNFNFADADSRIKSEARGSYDTKLKRSLERLFQDMADTGVRPFDYVIIDCSPNLDLTTTNAIVALEAGNEASTCIVPIRIDGFAVAGLEQTINWIEDTRRDRNQNAKCWAILRTMVEKNTAAYKYGSEKIDEKYPHAAYFESEIPKSTVVTESTLVMQPLLKYKPKSKPAIAYTGFVKEIEERYAAERRD
jgi:chromosome partitioning protein